MTIGGNFAHLLQQVQPLVRIAVDRHDADVGLRLADDVGKELVPRTFRFEPNNVHTQQHVFQLRATVVAGVDNGQTKNVAHRESGAVTLPSNLRPKQFGSQTLGFGTRELRRLLMLSAFKSRLRLTVRRKRAAKSY